MAILPWSIFPVTLCIINILAVDPTEYFEYPRESSLENIEEIIRIVNETVTFKCSKENNVEWKFRNEENDEFRPMSESQIFEIRNLTITDEGVYACYSNKHLVSAYKLIINEPPSFIKKNPMQPLVVKPAGNMAQLKCRAVGHPTPNITWLKDGKPPKRHLGELKYNHWSLTLEDLVTDDKGNYTCVVCNIAGCIDFTYRVDVVERYHNKPILTKTPENITAALGSNVSFQCEYLSDLHPFITWMRLADDPGKDDTVVKDGNALNPEKLEITNVTYEDQGWYACVAANSLGQTVSKAYLTVVDVLPEKSIDNGQNEEADKDGKNQLMKNRFYEKLMQALSMLYF